MTREIAHEKTKRNKSLRKTSKHTIYPAFLMAEWKTTPASPNVMAPRGFGYYDAFHNLPDSAMTHMSIGPATPMNAKCFARCDHFWRMNVQKGSR